MIEVLEVFETP